MIVSEFGGSTRLIVAIREVPFESNEWRPVEGFACNKGEHPAMAHPDDNRVWACRACRMVTDCVSMYFHHV